jgi:hypothetical protein
MPLPSASTRYKIAKILLVTGLVAFVAAIVGVTLIAFAIIPWTPLPTAAVVILLVAGFASTIAAGILGAINTALLGKSGRN